MTTSKQAWTDDQLAAYECAVATIGNMIALVARQLADEKGKAQPDKTVIADLRCRQRHLVLERNRLDLEDHDAIANAITRYGHIVRQSLI